MELRSGVHRALREEDETSLSHSISCSLHSSGSSTPCSDDVASSSCTMDCTGLSTKESNCSCLRTQVSPREAKWKPLLTTFAGDSRVNRNPGDVTGTGVLSSSTARTARSPEKKVSKGAQAVFSVAPALPGCWPFHYHEFLHATGRKATSNLLGHISSALGLWTTTPNQVTTPQAPRHPWRRHFSTPPRAPLNIYSESVTIRILWWFNMGITSVSTK